ncbi:hypothetical protein AYK21_03870 [Thermoplasmatales archaeon SG8-52-2]|nr:MAG: hypothetical protein AYK21_03870 [Thermoplasmatales archaeon SG8-52-2]
MKIWKISIILIGVLIIILSSTTVSAKTETDATGDVYHWKMVDSTWSWQKSSSPKSYIDVTELSYTVNGNQLTLEIKVAGNIQDSENIIYGVWLNTSDATYYMSLHNNQNIVMGQLDAGGMPAVSTDITVSGNTISGNIGLVGTDETSLKFWGYAYEYTEYGDKNQEWWGDWIPGDYAPFTIDDDGTNGQGNDNGSPGFETVAVITALAIAIIIFRRRK